MGKHHGPDLFTWIFCHHHESNDVHLLPDTEFNEHELEHGVHCLCQPEIAELDEAVEDSRGNIVRYAIRHRAWVERGAIPHNLPEEFFEGDE